MKKTTKLLALLAAGVISLGTAHKASAAFANGDLIISFQATGGQGVSTTYVANLGAAHTYRDASSNISNIINFGTDLASIYGANWYERTDLYFNIIGNKAAGFSPANQGAPVTNGDARNTIYLGRSRSTANATDYTAWTGAPSALGTVGTQVQSYNSAVALALVSTDATSIPTATVNTIEEFTTPASGLLVNFSNFSADFNQAFGPGALFGGYEGALTLQRINRIDTQTGDLASNIVVSGIAAGTGSNEGYFAITSTGQVDYIAAGSGGSSVYTLHDYRQQ
jgi:hypothetical protein